MGCDYLVIISDTYEEHDTKWAIDKPYFEVGEDSGGYMDVETEYYFAEESLFVNNGLTPITDELIEKVRKINVKLADWLVPYKGKNAVGDWW
jgi:hypothetical protein